jgi:hypothetical protein
VVNTTQDLGGSYSVTTNFVAEFVFPICSAVAWCIDFFFVEIPELNGIVLNQPAVKLTA